MIKNKSTISPLIPLANIPEQSRDNYTFGNRKELLFNLNEIPQLEYDKSITQRVLFSFSLSFKY